MRIIPALFVLVTALWFPALAVAQQASTQPPVIAPLPVTPPPITPPVPPPVVTPVAPPPQTPPLVTPPAPAAAEEPDNTLPNVDDTTVDPAEEDLSLGEVPAVEPVELTPETARKALDVYALVSDKYQNAELENFENLQDFVDQAPQGKAFEADIKAAGFENVSTWNNTVTTINFAYANHIDDQTVETLQQIEDIKADPGLAQDMRDRMISALQALIPSPNNKKIIEDLVKDPVYGVKIKLLEPEGE